MKFFNVILILIVLVFLSEIFTRKTLRKNNKRSKTMKGLSSNIPYEDWENIIKIANDFSYRKKHVVNDGVMQNVGDEILNGATRAIFYLLKTSQTLVVSFRGTEGASDYDSWMTNLNYNEEEISTCVNDQKVKVHLGFKNAYDTVRELVLNRVIENINSFNNIIVTGHSKGGALAHLAYLDIGCYFLDRRKKESVNLITFGSPKVGNFKFKSSMNQLGDYMNGIIARYVNGNDIVPTVPPEPFKHCGTLIFVETNNKLAKKYDFQPMIGSVYSSEDTEQISVEKEKYQKFLSTINFSSINDHLNYIALSETDFIYSLTQLKDKIDPPQIKETYMSSSHKDSSTEGLRYRGKKG